MVELPEQMLPTARSLSFTLVHIQHYHATTNSLEHPVTHSTLIVAIRGKLQVLMNGVRLNLLPGELLSLTSPVTVQLLGDEDSSCTYYIITYTMQKDSASQDPYTVQDMLLTDQACWRVPWQRLARRLEQIHDASMHSDPLQQLANHIHFQEWMLFILLERNLHKSMEQDHQKAVEHAIEYMHSAYHDDITVDKLADEARMSRRQFTSLFRKLTNRSVTDYLTELRISRAKQLLLLGGRLADIAQTVGYRDEFYFNRRFKQTVGQSPRQYAREKQNGLRVFTLANSPRRVVADQYMGELLKLGVIPVGVRSNMLKNLAASQLNDHVRGNIADVGTGFPISLAHVNQLQPDLIVTQNNQQYSQLEQIAPTILIPYQSTGPLEKFRLISSIFDKTQLAEQWIYEYEWRTEQARTQIRNKHGLGLSTTNLLYLDGQLFVMGQYAGYGSFSLYHSLQLQVPNRQRKELSESKLSVQIPLTALPDYASDYIFLTSYGDPSLLTESSVWRKLPAVKEGRVHLCNPYRFSFEDPYSLDEQLQFITSRLL